MRRIDWIMIIALAVLALGGKLANFGESSINPQTPQIHADHLLKFSAINFGVQRHKIGYPKTHKKAEKITWLLLNFLKLERYNKTRNELHP